MADINNLIFPDLPKRIIDCQDSETYDQLYFVGTENSYFKKSGKTDIGSVSSMGNFWVNQGQVRSKFRDILDGGDSKKGTSQFNGPIIGGEFPTERGPLNSVPSPIRQ